MTAALLAAAAFAEAWTITPAGSLSFQGEIWTPVGVRIPGTPEAIKEAHDAGIRDVAVELPASGEGWGPALSSLKERNMRYLIALSSPAPPLAAWVIEPAGYRRSPLSDAFRLSWPMPYVEEVQAALISRRQGTLLWEAKVPAKDGIVTVAADPRGLDSALLLFPRTQKAPYPDFWDGWDAHRDGLLRTLRSQPLGQGFRGLLNPAGVVEAFPGESPLAVPTSRIFRIELEQLLEERYKTVGEALKAWGLRANEIKSFTEIAKLVPLWGGGRGASFYLDSTKGTLLAADPARSSAWRDIKDVLVEAMHRRINRLVASIRSIADVPVFQDSLGWDGPQERSATALAGVGAKLAPSSLASAMDSLAQPAGAIGTWIRPGWLFASDLAVDERSPHPQDLVLQSSALGVRGWFFSAPPSAYPQVAKAAESASSLASRLNARTQFLLYPQSIQGLASTKLLPDGRWWAPSPHEGERVYLGREVVGYRSNGPGEPSLVIWSRGEAVRLRLRVSAPGAIGVQTTDGAPARSAVRGRNILELTVGSSPVILTGLTEMPAPVEVFNEMASDITAFNEAFGSRMQDGGQIESDLGEAVRTFNDQPSASYIKLSAAYLRAIPRAAPYLWIEAEQIAGQTFPDLSPYPGASGGRVISAPARLGKAEGQARFTVNARRNARHEIWVAGSFPKGSEGRLRLTINGEEFALPPDDAQVYSDGLSWRKLGETDLDAEPRIATLKAEAPLGTTLSLDVIVFSPDRFTPDGAFPPTGWASSIPRLSGPPRMDSGGLSSPPPNLPASVATPTRQAR